MSSPNLKAACLSVGLVSAWAATADAEIITEVRYETNFLAEVTHARLMLTGLGSGSNQVFLNILSLPGSGSGYISSELEASLFGDHYAMIGLYGAGSGTYGVMITTPGLTILNGLQFEEVFPGVSEQLLVQQLLADSPAVNDFMRSEFATLRTRHEFAATCYSFSEASPFGSMTVEVVTVPAPPAAAAAILPIFYLAHRRRRR